MRRALKLRIGVAAAALVAATGAAALVSAGLLDRTDAPQAADSPGSPSPAATVAPPEPTSTRSPAPATPRPAAPSPTAAAPSTAPTRTASAAETLPAVGQALDVTELASQVSQIRGLDVSEPVRARAVTRDELAATVRALGFGWGDPAEVESSQRILVALRLIPAEFDLGGQGTELYAEQVVGVYALSEQTLFVHGVPGQLTPYAEFIAAHEITHALQDRTFDLEPLRDLPPEAADASTALLALIEGDAVVTQREWSARFQSQAQRAELRREAGSGSNAVLASTPSYLRAILEFPYREGTAFVTELMRQDGYAAVDKAYASPPTTTEQIMHPDSYLAGEGATPVTLAGSPRGGFEHEARATFGQFDVRELFRPLGLGRAERVAIGWAGGEVAWWWTDEATAVSLALTFDTVADADDACEAAPAWYAAAAGGIADGADASLLRSDRDWMAFRCEGDRVWLGIAADAEEALELAGAGARSRG
ncbi:MAG TPA: hypothetical protein VML96_00435 [Egibacteraceae bacterium]|nr:hypothetical protein [Egibacteraceae bacterium]